MGWEGFYDLSGGIGDSGGVWIDVYGCTNGRGYNLVDPYNICIVCTYYLIPLVYLYVNLQLLSISKLPVRHGVFYVVPLQVPRRNVMIGDLFFLNSCILERCYYCYSLCHGWPEGHVVL